jgi:hypothetical protein
VNESINNQFYMESSDTFSTLAHNTHKRVPSLGFGNTLFLIALCVDLFTPILIWKGLIPANFRWISYAIVLAMMIGCVFRMLLTDYIPRVFLLIIAFSIIWGFIAIAQGQSALSTLWGWWLFFQFPFVGLFIYLQPDLTEKIPGYFRKIVVLLLILEVAIQVVQYLTGEAPGDNLAGSFGWHGTGNLILFILCINCLFFGFWITRKKWVALIFILTLSTLSSVLGEIKLFPIAIFALGLLAAIIYAIKYHSLFQLVKYLVILSIIFVSFLYLYNKVVVKEKNNSLQQFLTNPQAVSKYFNISIRGYYGDSYFTNIGRNYALRIGLISLQKDTFTLLFGWGLGSRSESKSLDTAGIGLLSGDLGLSVGTSLLIMMQEFGILGLIFLSIFYLWLILKLIQGIRNFPNSNATEFRYGLLLFTIFWPVWLWYNTAWTLRVPMLLYWASLGYVFRESNHPGHRYKLMHGEIQNDS